MIYEKIANAKQQIAETPMKKLGKNTFSGYEYFTPEQVNILVQKACNDNGLLTAFSLKRNEFGEFWVLTVYDVETWEKLEVEGATAIPEIKATNLAQQIWGAMTYTERYLKSSLFWIVSNELDFDTTENTMKTAWVEKPKMTDVQYKNFIKVKDSYAWADEAVRKAKEKYIVDDVMEGKIRSVYIKDAIVWQK